MRTSSSTPISSWLLVFVIGCSGSGQFPETVPVSGTVTYKGNPVPGIMITFLDADRDGSRPASGITDQSGHYRLTTFKANDGAIPGEKKVQINVVPPGDADSPVKFADPTVQIPKRYSNSEASGLTATVENQNTVVDLDLRE